MTRGFLNNINEKNDTLFNGETKTKNSVNDPNKSRTREVMKNEVTNF